MDGLARKSVSHLNTEGRERVLIVGLCREETESRLDKGIETLLTWKVGGIAGNTRPIEGSRINGVVAWLALHQCQRTAHIVLDVTEFFLVIAPCQHVEVDTNGGQPLRVGYVEILLYPLFVNLIASAVSCKRVHVACLLLKPLQVIITVLDEEVLIIDMVAGQQQANGSGKGQSAVASVR